MLQKNPVQNLSSIKTPKAAQTGLWENPSNPPLVPPPGQNYTDDWLTSRPSQARSPIAIGFAWRLVPTSSGMTPASRRGGSGAAGLKSAESAPAGPSGRVPCPPLRWRPQAWRPGPSAARRRSRPRARSTRPRCAASGRRRCRTSCTAPWRSSSCSGTCRWAPGARGMVEGGPLRATWDGRVAFPPRDLSVSLPLALGVQTPPLPLTSVPNSG